jgi:hypothetical protein
VCKHVKRKEIIDSVILLVDTFHVTKETDNGWIVVGNEHVFDIMVSLAVHCKFVIS